MIEEGEIMEFKHGQVGICEVNKKYIDYLSAFENHLNIPKHRKFTGIIITDGKLDYCVPLTTMVYSHNGEKRPDELTTTIKVNGNSIAVAMHNYMIPVLPDVYNIFDINNSEDKEYLHNEIIYIRDHKKEFLKKSEFVLSEECKNTYENIFCFDSLKTACKKFILK